jgi:hypothetical protein
MTKRKTRGHTSTITGGHVSGDGGDPTKAMLAAAGNYTSRRGITLPKIKFMETEDQQKDDSK